MYLSIIIPTYNEEESIGNLISYLKSDKSASLIKEIIIADGGSTDATVDKVTDSGAILVRCTRKGRAAQMNEGAAAAHGTVLYFLHADTYPPAGFASKIKHEINNGHCSGCFRLQFDHEHWFLKANCWFTRFDINVFRFGDQSLFVTRDVFGSVKGFDENRIVFEDQEIIYRIRKQCMFKVVDQNVLTSARKYIENGIYKTQGIYFLLFFMYRSGFSQKQLITTYRKLIKHQNKV